MRECEANERGRCLCHVQAAAASTGLVVVAGLGALAYQRDGFRPVESAGMGVRAAMRAAMDARWAALWPAAEAAALLPVAAAVHRGRE